MTDNDQKAGCGKDSMGADGVKLAGLVKKLVWTPFGASYTAYDPTRLHQAITSDPAAYDADRTARILAALNTDAIAALVGALKEARPYVENMAYGWPEAKTTIRRIDTALARLGGGE
jgi:hypothetical protein